MFVIGGPASMTFYDARNMPRLTPSEVLETLVSTCLWLQVLHNSHVLCLHADGVLTLWNPQGQRLRQLLDGCTGVRWHVAPNPRGDQLVVLTATAVVAMGGTGMTDNWEVVCAASPVALDVAWDDQGPVGARPRALLAVALADGTLFVEALDLRARPTSLYMLVLKQPSAVVFSLLSLHCDQGCATVAASGGGGHVRLWRASDRRARGAETLRCGPRPIVGLHTTSYVACAIDTWTSVYVFDIVSPLPSQPRPPAYVINDPSHMEPHAWRFGLGCPGAQAVAQGDFLFVGPQALTEQVQLLQFGARRPPRLKRHTYGPVWRMRCEMALFISCLISFLLLMGAAPEHEFYYPTVNATANVTAAPKPRAAAARAAVKAAAKAVAKAAAKATGKAAATAAATPATEKTAADPTNYFYQIVPFSMLLATAFSVAVYCYTPLRAYNHGILFWSAAGGFLSLCMGIALFPRSDFGPLVLPYLCSIVWRVYYCYGPLAQAYHMKGAQRPYPPPADPADWLHRSPLHMLWLLFMPDIIMMPGFGYDIYRSHVKPAREPPSAVFVGFACSLLSITLWIEWGRLLNLFNQAIVLRQPLPANRFFRQAYIVLTFGFLAVVCLPMRKLFHMCCLTLLIGSLVGLTVYRYKLQRI